MIQDQFVCFQLMTIWPQATAEQPTFRGISVALQETSATNLDLDILTKPHCAPFMSRAFHLWIQWSMEPIEPTALIGAQCQCNYLNSQWWGWVGGGWEPKGTVYFPCQLLAPLQWLMKILTFQIIENINPWQSLWHDKKWYWTAFAICAIYAFIELQLVTDAMVYHVTLTWREIRQR